MCRRVFWFVMDSFGIGEMPDAIEFGDEGSNTLRSVSESSYFHAPFLSSLGLFNIEGINFGRKSKEPLASYARMTELSRGKDTMIGHWEMAGIVSDKPLPLFPEGFSRDILEAVENFSGRGTICNKPYSGTEVIKKYGEEHVRTGKLIVYTSGDSVFQIAANENVVPLDELYRICSFARNLFDEKGVNVGRVIARPFVGTNSLNFNRTSNRHDFSMQPPALSVLDYLHQCGNDVIAIGKIFDIFNGSGITEYKRTKNNADAMRIVSEYVSKNFNGLCFVNLVDFDMLYGHRNDIGGYAKAVTEFDALMREFHQKLRKDDIVIITADHGCDPGTPSTDHSREYVPMLIFGNNICKGINLGTRSTFADMGQTIAEYLKVKADIYGSSYLKFVIKN